MVQRQGTSNGWISSIVTGRYFVGMPDDYTHRCIMGIIRLIEIHTLTNITSNRSDVTVTGTVTINSNFAATIIFNVRRGSRRVIQQHQLGFVEMLD